MDPRLVAIAAQAAGTYFLVTDNSLVPTTTVPPNLRIIFINVPQGPVNTVVVFQQGDTMGLASIFGNISRKSERGGNFSLRVCQTALSGGPIGVINLRTFTSADSIGIAGISPNFTSEETKTTEYDNVFNTNGFWTVQSKNIQPQLTKQNYLNLANVGVANVSVFVVKSLPINYQPLTSQYSKTLTTMSLDVDDYPGLDMNMLLSDTFVDVYVFNNVFPADTVSTNRYYGQLFNADGTINYENLPALAAISQSGFNRVITGSLLPNLLSESSTDLSIDTLLNTLYPDTGVIGHINDNLLEDDLTEVPVLNMTAKDYWNSDGTLNTPLGGSPTLLSHSFAAVEEVGTSSIDAVTDADVINKNAQLLFETTGTIFPIDAPQNQVYAIYEQGIRVGDEIVFMDTDIEETQSVQVTGLSIIQQNIPTGPTVLTPLAASTLTIPVPQTVTNILLNWTAVSGAEKYDVYRKKSTDANYVAIAQNLAVLTFNDLTVAPLTIYYYYVQAKTSDATKAAKNSNGLQFTTLAASDIVGNLGVSSATPTQPTQPATTIAGIKTWTKALLTLSGLIDGASYVRKKAFTGIAGIGTIPTFLSAYVPRVEQFTDGTAVTQSSILDVMVTPSIVKGLSAFPQARYLIDAFKSYVEASYKQQFGALALALDQRNSFVRNIIQEPFIEDLIASTNPLFSQGPSQPFDPTYLPLGGNDDYSTVLLSKFGPGAEFSFFFGSGQVDVKANVYPITGEVSNVFIAKQNQYDVAANASGYLTGIQGMEESPNAETDRLPFEQFLWNAIIAQKGSFTIYGNFTGQKADTTLQAIHNSELLAYIKQQLLAMSVDDPFKKGTYNNYLSSQTEINTFFVNLALAGAILPNPVVVCDATNNTADVSKAKIKLIHVEYQGVDALDKTVFDLNLN
jgi:hypothetical protein